MDLRIEELFIEMRKMNKKMWDLEIKIVEWNFLKSNFNIFYYTAIFLIREKK